MVPTRAMSPHVPISVEEIVEAVHRAVELGITIAHLHAREADGTPSCRGDLYAEIITRIRRFAPELVICASLSGRNFPGLAQRSAPLTLQGDAKPDMGSLTLSSLNFPRQASVNAPDVIQGLASEMQRAGVLPELEVFDAGMIQYSRYLIRKGLLPTPLYFNLLLGNLSSAQLDALHLGVLLRDLPPGSHWALGGIGEAQWPASQLAMALGGGVRVGLEDNLYRDAGRTQLATNAELLGRVHELAALAERPMLSSAEFRRLFHLQPGHGAYGLAPDLEPRIDTAALDSLA
jgi:uncharacterized protein (DUF849 family)